VCHKTWILFNTTSGKEAVFAMNMEKNTTVNCFQIYGERVDSGVGFEVDSTHKF
jgi:hypothetical protein